MLEVALILCRCQGIFSEGPFSFQPAIQLIPDPFSRPAGTAALPWYTEIWVYSRHTSKAGAKLLQNLLAWHHCKGTHGAMPECKYVIPLCSDPEGLSEIARALGPTSMEEPINWLIRADQIGSILKKKEGILKFSLRLIITIFHIWCRRTGGS